MNHTNIKPDDHELSALTAHTLHVLQINDEPISENEPDHSLVKDNETFNPLSLVIDVNAVTAYEILSSILTAVDHRVTYLAEFPSTRAAEYTLLDSSTLIYFVYPLCVHFYSTQRTRNNDFAEELAMLYYDTVNTAKQHFPEQAHNWPAEIESEPKR